MCVYIYICIYIPTYAQRERERENRPLLLSMYIYTHMCIIYIVHTHVCAHAVVCSDCMYVCMYVCMYAQCLCAHYILSHNCQTALIIIGCALRWSNVVRQKHTNTCIHNNILHTFMHAGYILLRLCVQSLSWWRPHPHPFMQRNLVHWHTRSEEPANIKP